MTTHSTRLQPRASKRDCTHCGPGPSKTSTSHHGLAQSPVPPASSPPPAPASLGRAWPRGHSMPTGRWWRRDGWDLRPTRLTCAPTKPPTPCGLECTTEVSQSSNDEYVVTKRHPQGLTHPTVLVGPNGWTR